MLFKRGRIWWYKFMYRNVLYRGSTGETTKPLALKVEQKERAKVEHPRARFETGASLTLRDAAERLYDEVWEDKSAGLLQFNRIVYITEAFDNPFLSDIRGAWVQCLKVFLKADGKGPTTVNRYLAHVRKLLNHARLHWEMEDITVPAFQMNDEPEGRLRVITPGELGTMLQLLRNPKGKRQAHFPVVADLFELLHDTGMRLSEALQLKSGNVDLSRKLITLTSTMTKTKRTRIIPLTDRAVDVLARLPKSAPFGEIDFDQCQSAMRYLKRTMGIEDTDFCIHALRHTFASNLLNAGEDLYTVSRLLGHSSVEVTQRYAHLLLKTLQQAIQQLN